MTEVRVRWCAFCRCNKDESTFTKVFDRRGRAVTRKCGDCSRLSKLSQQERDARGKKQREKNKAHATAYWRRITETREEKRANKKKEG